MSETRGPSAWLLEKSVSAWQQLRTALLTDTALADDEDVLRAAIGEAMEAEGVETPEELLRRLIDAAVWCDRREAEADELRREVTERRDRYAMRGENIRTTILSLMAALDVRRQRGRIGSASISAAPASVLITDEKALTDEFVTITRTPRKTDIKAAIQSGRFVAGAVMSNAGEILTIRKLR